MRRLQRTFRAAVGGADVFRDFQTMRGAAQLVLSASQGVVAGEDRGRHGGGGLPPTSHTSLQCCGPSPGRGAADASPDFSPLARKEANYSGTLHPRGGVLGSGQFGVGSATWPSIAEGAGGLDMAISNVKWLSWPGMDPKPTPPRAGGMGRHPSLFPPGVGKKKLVPFPPGLLPLFCLCNKQGGPQGGESFLR